MNVLYDSRTYDASRDATFFVSRAKSQCYPTPVDSADEILAELKRRNVTHAQIAAALGVATTNATKLYNPASKTGKPRRMTYDEGAMLIKAFALDAEGEPLRLAPLSLPVARLVVLYVASQLHMAEPVDDHIVEETARDVQAFSEFATQPHLRESESHVDGFFQGLRSQSRRSARG